MKRILKECFHALMEAVFIAVILYFVMWPVHINGSSMQETFHSGDRAAISRVLTYFRQYSRGDIVVVKTGTAQLGPDRDIIKRIIAVPGDHLVISHGIVVLNGERLAEEYTGGVPTDGDVNIILGDDEYFLMGDNRPDSVDSRCFGAVRRGDIIGRVIFKFYPFNEVMFF